MARRLRDLIPFHNPLHVRTTTRVGRSRKRRIQWPLVWRWVRLLMVLGIFLTAGLFAWYAKDLPTPGKIRDRQAAESTKIVASRGELLYEVHGEENRTNLAFNQIPETVKHATLVAEDRTFYTHFGLDFKGLARAVFLDVFTGARVGGSTITQQFVKNALLTNQKTFDRKIKELILALELEAMFTKDEIFTFYLNEIPYGSNNYGIQAAAQAYYGKHANELALHEAATLAALPQAPTYYSPYGTHTDVLLGRRDWILTSMAELGYISEEEAAEAKQQPLGVQPRRDSIKAPHFVFYVREQLVELFGEQLVEEGGLRVTTSLDLPLQAEAEQAIQAGMARVRQRGGSNAALVSVSPKSGHVLTMVGSQDYFDTEHDGNVNVTLAERQPGSSFKPIVYATGFKREFSPTTTLWDVPTDFGNYAPNNYDGNFRGPISARQALAGSLNIPAVKMLGLVGLNEALKTAHDIGITTLNQPERYGLSLVLGGGEVRPLDMATAFSTFANGGTYRPPVSILKVEDPNGKVLFEHQERKGEKEVLDPSVAYLVTDVLKDNEARAHIFGSRSALYFADRPVAAKTGTTQEYRDGWTVGYTPSIATAVWVGNNDNTPMHKGADGSVVAAPIFNKFMTASFGSNEIESFTKPNVIREYAVDRLSGKLPSQDSPEIVYDLFAPWHAPKEKDTIHVRATVNRLNGKLATEYTPVDLREERTYTVIHSERPADPRWEEPVLAWAKDHGLAIGDPPTEIDDYSAVTVPEVHITSPSDGATVVGTVAVTTRASAHFGLSSVSLAIDGTMLATRTEAPYDFTIDTSTLVAGSHTLTASASDVHGASATTTITIGVQGDVTPPGPVTAVTAVPKNQSAKLQWLNPADADLERIRIYVSQSPTILGTLYSTEVLVTPSSISSYTVTGLVNGIPYYFTIRPLDRLGNERATPPYNATATPGL
ncbi:PBP1A family penicillin-binding protein [Candidatus Berkelbacteria bacterium]|nr:PBP1A family penicillin-binding protein [Candidatus Berkelbacteria bacterium]